MPRWVCLSLISSGLIRAAEPLPFEVKLETAVKSDHPDWQWFHPRPAMIPGFGVMLTIQKHLRVSDYYSGLYMMTARGPGQPWTGPVEIPELGWMTESAGVDIAVADVTPGWHRASGKLIAVGAQVRYSKKGEQLDDRARSHQTAYAVFDPVARKWSRWKTVRMPPGTKFDFARSACAQWLEMEDGTVLLPFYNGPNAKEPHWVTVARFGFDGSELAYQRHGSEHVLNEVRGLVEPSVVRFQGRYYLTVRNDLRGYVTSGADGLDYAPIQPWRFDDGSELGSYNTQQHWLSHSDGLFLAYTRRGANNDHIMRHRAPLFIAQVDETKLRVMRATEKILMPERGATLGNFGAATITSGESWVTDTEGMFSPQARQRGAEGATFIARVIWSKPNRDVEAPGVKAPELMSRSTVYAYPNRDPYSLENRFGFNHAANIGVLPGGRLMSCWFSGPFEASVHQAVLCSYSSDQGVTWTKAEVFSDFPRRSDFDPAMLMDSQRAWVFFSAGRWIRYPFINDERNKVGENSFQIYQRHSDDGGKTWSAAEAAQIEAGFNCRNNGIKLTSGELLLPVAKLRGAETGMLKSVDGGRTWKRHGAIATPMGNDEPTIAETNSGAVLMFLRTGGGTLWRTVSRDKGETWSKPERSSIPAARSSHSLFRLRDGRLLLTHDASTGPRSPVTMRVSDDEGETWGPPLVLATAPEWRGGSGEPRRQVSYPSVAQLGDGTLAVVYSDIGIADSEQWGDIQFARIRIR